MTSRLFAWAIPWIILLIAAYALIVLGLSISRGVAHRRRGRRDII